MRGGWSRGWRLTLFWVAMFVILLILIPAFVVAGAYFLGFGACDRPDTAAASAICSPIGSLLMGTVLWGSGGVLFFPLIRFLERKLSIDYVLKQTEYAATTLPESLLGRAEQLSPGQRLVVGQVESCSRFRRTAVFSGFGLTFWSLFPFYRGLIRTGDSLVVVYQTIPFSTHLRFALAYWDGSPNAVRGVAPIAQSLSVLFAAGLIGFVSMVPMPLPGLWIVLGGLGLVVSAVYLVLMFRAKAALRDFLRDAGCEL